MKRRKLSSNMVVHQDGTIEQIVKQILANASMRVTTLAHTMCDALQMLPPGKFYEYDVGQILDDILPVTLGFHLTERAHEGQIVIVPGAAHVIELWRDCGDDGGLWCYEVLTRAQVANRGVINHPEDDTDDGWDDWPLGPPS